jgi:TPR repeat protein
MFRFITLLAMLLPIGAHAGFEDATQAYGAGDYTKAMAEFKPLAEQGDAKSQYFVAKDDSEAANWFRKAAAQGDSLGAFYLGKMYEKGEGVEKDLTQAYLWLSVSAKNAPNARDAAYTREDIQKLERKMSPEQVAKAKELAKQWKPEKS